MPTITGNLRDFGLATLTPFSPKVTFRATNPAIDGTFVYSTKPVIVYPDFGGFMSFPLSETDTMLPVTWYTMTVEWLDASGGYVGADFPAWPIYVPAAGGNLVNLIATPWNPTLAWWGTSAPVGASVANTLWLNPTTGVLSIWSN